VSRLTRGTPSTGPDEANGGNSRPGHRRRPEAVSGHDRGPLDPGIRDPDDTPIPAARTGGRGPGAGRREPVPERPLPPGAGVRSLDEPRGPSLSSIDLPHADRAYRPTCECQQKVHPTAGRVTLRRTRPITPRLVSAPDVRGSGMPRSPAPVVVDPYPTRLRSPLPLCRPILLDRTDRPLLVDSPASGGSARYYWVRPPLAGPSQPCWTCSNSVWIRCFSPLRLAG
jgi:hypothetical protein